jgi:hypothetical protein
MHDSGWLPLVVALVFMLAMITWRRGTAILGDKVPKEGVPLPEIISMLAKNPPVRVEGTAMFLSGTPGNAPSALLHNLKHNKVLHEQNVMLHVHPHQPGSRGWFANDSLTGSQLCGWTRSPATTGRCHRALRPRKPGCESEEDC